MNKQLLKHIATPIATIITCAALITTVLADTVAVYDLEGAISESDQQSLSLMELAGSKAEAFRDQRVLLLAPSFNIQTK